MSKQRKAGVALFVTAIASLAGAMTGLFVLTLFPPMIAEAGLKFGPAEFFAMMVLGLVAASLSLGIPDDAVMAVVLGALIIHGIQPGPMLITEQPGTKDRTQGPNSGRRQVRNQPLAH